MKGSLQLYDKEKKLCFFEASMCSHDSPPTTTRLERPVFFILVGGMFDGPLSLPYTTALREIISASPAPQDQAMRPPIRLILPFLRSSYQHFGLYTLNDDVQDMLKLLHHLVAEGEAGEFILMGHSTGCQIILKTLQYIKEHEEAACHVRSGSKDIRIVGLILQGAVSDRQWMMATTPSGKTRSDLEAYVSMAKEMCRSGKKDECMPRDAYPVPIIAARYLSLVTFQ
jgi:pimeloyl-ACP methyl ester carboxylesterase